MTKPLIFITNDDGVRSKGLKTLMNLFKGKARMIVVSPEEGQSGMSQAITITKPLFLRKIADEEDIKIYACSGTPVDCVKIAFDELLQGKEQPDLILSGINHGSNSAVNVLYSGTMGAAIEGSFYNIPSVGLSIEDHDPEGDFSTASAFIPRIIEQVMGSDLGRPLCMNVNIPTLPAEQIKGIRVCRQTKGYWREDFERRQSPHGRDYYWLSGYFKNAEPDAEDTDEWALKNGYISIVPIQVDLTNYQQMGRMKEWKF